MGCGIDLISSQDCFNHSWAHGGKTIDKISFTIPKGHFWKKLWDDDNWRILLPQVTLTNLHNGLVKLHIHGEYIDPNEPMLWSVMKIFYQITQKRVFHKEVNDPLWYILSINQYSPHQNFDCDVLLVLARQGFRFSELELAFDFFGCKPYVSIRKEYFRRYFGAVYSTDWKHYKRKCFKEDDSLGYESNGKRHSILCIYNRGSKLGIPQTVWRVEWRLRDERAACLDMGDLLCSMDEFILLKGRRVKAITENYVKPGYINFDTQYIYQNFPIFAHLITV
jgi:hypothetical protein